MNPIFEELDKLREIDHMELIDKQKPFTVDELDRHEKRLEDWPDAQPKYETLARYINQIRVQQEEIAKLKEELKLTNGAHEHAERDFERWKARAIQAEQERDEWKQEWNRMGSELIDAGQQKVNLLSLLRQKEDEIKRLKTIVHGVQND